MFKGVCIGGPLDRKWVEIEDIGFNVIDLDPLIYTGTDVPWPDEVAPFTYRNVTMNGGFFWVPEEILDGGTFDGVTYVNEGTYITIRMSEVYIRR